MIGCPSMKDFKKMVSNNLIHNCLVTIENIEIAEKSLDWTFHP